MKLNKILFGVLAAALMSACSSDDVTSGGKKPSGGGFNGDGYIAVKVNLPTTSSSAFRAANDNYDDGTANEYKVDNAALLLFKGTNESDATFQGMYDLHLMGNQSTDPDNDNITSEYTKAVKVEDVTLGNDDNLYGLVVINYDDVMTLSETGCIINGTNFNGTFKELVEKTTENALKSTKDDHFFMANAPLSNAIGGNATTAPTLSNVTTLVKLTGELKSTEEEAKNSPAGNVYVERAIAKATLNANNASVEIKEGDSDTKATVKTVEWALGNTEASSYIVRNLGADAEQYIGYKNDKRDNYRFVGTLAMNHQLSNKDVLYRTYWCIDPAYNKDKQYDEKETFNFIEAGSKPLYCHENTFDIAHQNYKNTTRAVLKVTFKGGTFYTVNGDLTKAYTPDNAKSHAIKEAVENKALENLFQQNLKAGEEVNYTNCVQATFSTNEISKVVTLSNLTINIPDNLKDKFENSDFQLDDETKNFILNTVNNNIRLVEYTEGISYYDLRFKHFAGDNANNENDLAPWEETTGNTTSEVYDNDAKNYLGRYGMVRNNWYDVNVSAFKNIGSPVIPNANVDKSDDSKTEEKWIAFSINILSWAKRTQSYEF